jgi:hypothetical chaperone protein
MSVGIDFGTTNSAVALARSREDIRLAHFPGGGIMLDVFRSALFFHESRNGARRKTETFAGNEAIDRYLSGAEGRFVQSLKSYLPVRGLTATNILGRMYQFVDLIAILLRGLRSSSERSLGPLGNHAVIGRPVRFADAASEEDERFALARLESAAHKSGIEHVTFEYEPVAAAYHYERGLDHDELILVGDFGGGTSDFSLINVGPNTIAEGTRRVMGNAGIGIAGDAFDAAIVHHVVSPILGKDGLYASLGKHLTIPAWIYSKLERWHHLSFLKTRENVQAIRAIRSAALDPEPLDALLLIIEEDLGFELHRSVQEIKRDLSIHESAEFVFEVPGISLSKVVLRSDFENWIAEQLGAITSCLDDFLRASGVSHSDVDRVFLTGGSSFVPAIRRIFETRFGTGKLAGGSEFTSVTSGLALRSLELTS